MAEARFSSSLIIDPLAFHDELGCGGPGAWADKAVDIKRAWFEGSSDGGSAGCGI